VHRRRSSPVGKAKPDRFDRLSMVGRCNTLTCMGSEMTVMAEAVPSNRERFKLLLRKIGSGEHTSSSLSRLEARQAMEMMLTGQASSAQIGAFLIAHRIRRPEPQELAGMLDLYHQLGPSLRSVKRTICFGMPFDGRTRTAPIYPLTALVLAAAGLPVMLQGGGRMPVKYGVTAMELFTSLGLGLEGLSLELLEEGLDQHGLALLHQPDHFPLAESLNDVRADLGKRPPVASLELLWTAHRGPHLLVSGFVHPPTEARAWKTLHLAGEADLITVKGLEGSTDLPISRACITARVRDGQAERMILHPRDHDCYAPDVPWTDLEDWSRQAMEALGGHGPLLKSVVWNAGSYLWMADILPTHEQGLEKARHLLFSGAARSKLRQLIEWRRDVA
jgi:anthranilate phosphoribosyltransferase